MLEKDIPAYLLRKECN